MKNLLFFVVVLALTALAFPVSNLLRDAPLNKLTKAKPRDPLRAKFFKMLGTKCADCHSSETAWPFYAEFPYVEGLLEKDIQLARQRLNYPAELCAEPNQPISEVLLAKTEAKLRAGTMPPLRYRLLHWKARFSAEEKADLLDWLHAERTKPHAAPFVMPQSQNDAIPPLDK